MAESVDVYLDGRKVGTLAHERGPASAVTFTYDEAVVDDATAAVSVRLPVRNAPYDERHVLPCFENLLPEGDLRDALASDVHRDRGDVVGLLGVFGGECAGALSLWPSGPSRRSRRSIGLAPPRMCARRSSLRHWRGRRISPNLATMAETIWPPCCAPAPCP